MGRWEGWRWMLLAGRLVSSCLLVEEVAVVGTETMTGDKEGASNHDRITWSTEPRKGRTCVRSRMVAPRGGTTKMVTMATAKAARCGVEVPVPILLQVRFMAEVATRGKSQEMREGAARADRVVVEGVEAPPLRPLHHRPVVAAAAAAAAAVRRADAEGVDAVAGVQEGADVGEIVHLAAGEIGEDVADVGRPPAVVQVQVAAAAAAVAVPIPRRHLPRHRGRNLGVARSAVEAEAHRVSLRG